MILEATQKIHCILFHQILELEFPTSPACWGVRGRIHGMVCRCVGQGGLWQVCGPLHFLSARIAVSDFLWDSAISSGENEALGRE